MIKYIGAYILCISIPIYTIFKMEIMDMRTLILLSVGIFIVGWKIYCDNNICINTKKRGE
tara:strand:- start:5 stop:184 length:180 start_codon:yes stop_codon:yes gene_type:complete